MTNIEILLNSLLFPEGARRGYFRKQQKESGFDVNSFVVLMLDAIQKLKSDFERSAEISGGGLLEISPDSISKPIHFYSPSAPMDKRFMKSDLERILLVIKSEFVTEDIKPNAMIYIYPFQKKWFDEMIKLIPDKLKEWHREEDKIGCAAFCELLKDEKLLGNKKEDTPRNFALSYFGVDLRIQFKKKKDLITHKLMLKKYFNDTRYYSGTKPVP